MLPKSVLITGASRGIGLELVRQFAELNNGPSLIFAACRTPAKADDLNSVANKHKDKVHLVALDVSNDDSIRDGVNAVERVLQAKHAKGLNLLINNAGIWGDRVTSWEQVTRANMQQVFETNTTSHVIATQKFLPLLKGASQGFEGPAEEMGAHRAAVLNISSGLGSIGDNNSGSFYSVAYRMSKTALNMFTKNLSIDLAGDKIMVVSMCPGWVQTDLGTSAAMLTPQQSISAIVGTICKLGKEATGGYVTRSGEKIQY